MKKSLLIILLILIADQALKFYIKLTMHIGEEFAVIGDWFIIHFTENNGMAFGLQIAGAWGKLALSLFRIIAVLALGMYLLLLTKRRTKFGPVFGIALILAGALGNIIDSTFYGVLFSQSTMHSVAQFLPESGGYANLLHGKVVDMFYFPLIVLYQNEVPAWVPKFIFGSDGYFIFFRPVFNIADASITIGIFWLVLFQRKFLRNL